MTRDGIGARTGAGRSPFAEVDRLELTPNTVETRFGMTIDTSDAESDTATMSMSLHDLVHPVTSRTSLGVVTILLDGVGGLINHRLRPPGRSTVTSELSLDLFRATEWLSDSIEARGTVLRSDDTGALAVVTLISGDVDVGFGTVRSFYIPAPAVMADRPVDTRTAAAPRTLFDMLALSERDTGDLADVDYALTPVPDRTLDNDNGAVHGGVVATSLEVAAVAAIAHATRDGAVMTTGAIRVIYLRPMIVGSDARYEGRSIRVGRNVAVADSVAVAADGRIAARAQITAYA